MLFALLDVSPEAAGGGMVATLLAVIAFAVKVGTWWVDRQRKKDMAAADHPVAPLPPAPVLQLPPEFAQRVARLEGALAKWSEDELRAEVRVLQRELREVKGDQASTAQQLVSKTYELEKVQLALRAMTAERDAAEARARKAIDELYESKHESASGFHGSAAITPLRPGAK